MKTFRILVTAGLVSAMILASAGCAGAQSSENSGTAASDTESQTTASAMTTESSEESEIEASDYAHQVLVEDLTKTTLSDEISEYTNSCPKLIVDGVEATEINASLSGYLQETYPLEMNGDFVDGYETRYVWGYNGNTVSIVIFASYVSEDYFTTEVFNYDLDTLMPLEACEVTKRLGMEDDEFLGKTTDIVTNYCEGKDYDLEKSIEAINYDNVTPFIMPDGNTGVAVSIYYSADSQFGGLASVRCFDMTTMERADL